MLLPFLPLTTTTLHLIHYILLVKTLLWVEVKLTVDSIVSWSQPVQWKLNDSRVNSASEGIIISFTLHSDSGCNTERWSTERHDAPHFRATEQLVQLTERQTQDGEKRKRVEIRLGCLQTACKKIKKELVLNDLPKIKNLLRWNIHTFHIYQLIALQPNNVMFQYFGLKGSLLHQICKGFKHIRNLFMPKNYVTFVFFFILRK